MFGGLGLGAALSSAASSASAAIRNISGYVRDNLKLYMPFKTASEVKFVGTGSTLFDGVNDYISASGSDSLNITGAQTWAGWIYPNATGDHAIFGRTRSDSPQELFYVLLTNSTNYIKVYINGEAVTGNDAVTLNTWSHITVTYDGAGNVKSYINGVLVDELSPSKTTLASDAAVGVQIGRKEQGTTHYFDGSIKNVGIWDRVLSQTEIQNVMYKTYGQLAGTEKTSLVSWWALDATGLGTELWDEDARTFAVGGTYNGSDPTEHATDTYGWIDEAPNGLENDAGTLKVTFAGGSAAGAYVKFRTNADLSTNLTAGRGYQLSFDVKVNAGSSVDLRLYVDSATTTYASVTETEFTTYTTTFTASNPTNDYFTFGGMTSGEIVWIDNMSLKEMNLEDLEGSNDGSNVGATIDTDLYGGDTPKIPRAVDNAPTARADTIGNGSALFDAANESVDIGSQSAFTSFSASNSGSITAWIKLTDYTSAGNIAIIGNNGGQSGGRGFVVYYDGTTDSIRLYMTGGSDVNLGGGVSNHIADNEWHHIAVVRTPSPTTSYYIDGVLKESNTTAQTSESGDSDYVLQIGCGGNDLLDWAGNIAQVGYWHGALSQAAIQEVKEKSFNELSVADKHKEKNGTELLTNGDFSAGTGSNATNWAGENTSRWVFDEDNDRYLWDESGGTTGADYPLKQLAAQIDSGGGIDIGKLYVLTIDITASKTVNMSLSGDNSSHKIARYEGSGTDDYFLPCTNGANVFYVKAFTSGAGANDDDLELHIDPDHSDPGDFYLNSISLKELDHNLVSYWTLDEVLSGDTIVSDKVDETLGSEIWDTDSSTFTVGGTHLGSSVETTDCYGWQKIGTNTIANVSGELRITYGDDGAGARSYLRDTYDLNGDLDTTKTYKLQFDAYADTDTNVKMTNNYFAWESEVFTTVKTTFVIYFVPNHATNMSLQLSAFSEGNVFLDNMSLKPVNGNPGQLK